MRAILIRSILSLLIVFSVCQCSLMAEDKTTFKSTVSPFLTKYCLDCHNAKKQKGDRRFDEITGVISDDNSLIDMQDILDLLNLHEMPPKESKQPSKDERQIVVQWLTQQITQYHDSRKDFTGESVLRRLNSREYRNTVRDLLHLNVTIFDPTQEFPRDQLTDHLDNNGQVLVTSGHLLAKYLVVAERVVDKALYPLEKPVGQQWAFRDNFKQQPEIDGARKKAHGLKYMNLYDVIGADKHEGAYGPIRAFTEGVPLDGYYDFRIKAEAVNRINPYDADYLGTDPSEPFRLGIVPGNYQVGALHHTQPIEPLLAEIELADEAKWYKVRVWLDAGYTPRFTFVNGLYDSRSLWSRIIKKYPDQFPKLKNGGIGEARNTAIKHSKLPQIHIHEIEIEGPIVERWPTASQQTLLGEDAASILTSGKMTESQMRNALSAFASEAYRRPVQPEEVDRVLSVIKKRQKTGRSDIEAYSDGIKMVLCSPNFLYLEEPNLAKTSDYALATRLSYFLWSSQPDRKLLNLAAANQLHDPLVLQQQLKRMLDDPKSDAFIDGFLGSWLTLRDLGSTPPDRGQFRSFYQYDLGTAMREETRLFTRHLLQENLSIANFLDSDFTFVNKPLAKHYGIPAPKGTGFQKVELTDKRRGGLLGQASVLTVTANGIDTSPVVRGVWLLENILGTPPSPPPPDVEPLDPDVRGAKSIRDQLNKHRENSSCYECHRKIDPLGFALENFDPVGKWRETYNKRVKIDASGELPSGKKFTDIVDLKAILVQQEDLFARSLTSKLLSYATGRHLVPADRPHIDRIVAELKEQNGGFRDLIQLIVLSEPFLQSHTESPLSQIK
ncbi:MAG: hypothetical protein COA78_03050 [Blastopirellula sp.]|nr:MAG: hypothetical protein COA78_03050 [Blastopirellula sp.]